LVYGNLHHSYETKSKDNELLNELLDPWIINTLSMAIQLSMKEHGYISQNKLEELIGLFR